MHGLIGACTVRRGVIFVWAAIIALTPAAADGLTMAWPVYAAVPAPIAPIFPGPRLGTPSVAVPTPASFAYTCNTAASAAPATAAGMALAAGAAIHDLDGCGQAVLYLNAPTNGRFRAAFAVGDTATGTSSILRLFLLGPGGFLLRTVDVTAVKAAAAAVDFDVSGGVTLALTFPTMTESYVYQMKLTGSARALASAPLANSGLPAGGVPVPKSAIQLTCNALSATAQSTVSQVAIPLTGTVRMESCGQITVHIPADARGALALRVGLGDDSSYSGLPSQVDLRVLDASGHLLRKAIGLAYLGSGLEPIWTNLQGGATATFTIDGGNTNVQLVVAGISFLPTAVLPHHNPDHQVFGNAGGAPIPISPDAVIGICDARTGTADTTVAHQALLRDTYLSVTGCGLAELIMSDAHGRFSARIGVDDSSTLYKTITAHVVVLDQNSKPLSTSSVTVHLGQPGVPISVNIEGASIVEITFSDHAYGDLYAMQLSGRAILYDRVFPPSEPPISTVDGMAVDPRLLAVSCDVSVTSQDMLLIHQVALEQWSLYFNGCGSATLNLATLPGPRRTFSCLYGIALQDQRYLIAYPQLTVLDAKGKVVRQATFTARAGYGPRRAAISLAGGTKLEITVTHNHPLVLFALTAA